MAGTEDDRYPPEVEVRVDGEPWRRVEDLAAAGAEDAVFTVDPATGAVRFGDGAHGRRPAAGQSVRALFRYGGGREQSVAYPWPSLAARFAVALDERGGIAGRLEVAGGTICEGPQRVHYFEGRLLTARDFQAEQDYHREGRRRHTRRLHGTGVVAGLALSVDGGTLRVGVGLAIDPAGEELEVATPWSGSIPAGAEWYVGLAYAECETDPVPVPGTEEPRPSRIQEGFRIGFAGAPDPAGVTLGRVVNRRGGWAVDPECRPPRAR